MTVFPDASQTRSRRSCSSKRVSESSCEKGSSSSRNRGSTDQRAGQRHALLRAERQFVRHLHGAVADADDVEIEACELTRLFPAARRRALRGRHQHVVEHVQPRQQARRLEHDRPLGPRCRDLGTVDDDAAKRGLVEPREDRQHGGFAAPRVPENGHERARQDPRVHVLHRHKRSRGGRKHASQTGQLQRNDHRASSSRRQAGLPDTAGSVVESAVVEPVDGGRLRRCIDAVSAATT